MNHDAPRGPLTRPRRLAWLHRFGPRGPVMITVAAILASAMAVAAPASASTTLCGTHARILQQSSGRDVVSRPNPFGTTQKFCIMAGTRPGFRIVTSLRRTGRVQAYPFTGVGCAYYLCSPHTDLPRRTRGIPKNAWLSWTWRGTSPGYWNASWDIWFDTRDQVTTQDNGAELMIWERTMPGYTSGSLVRVGGRRMRFMHWRTCHNGVCWNYIQFRFLRTTHSVHRLPLIPFIRFCARRGLIRWSWWVTSVHAGYELWSGGRGLTTTWFNAYV